MCRFCLGYSDGPVALALPLVARRSQGEEWSDTALPHLHTTRVNPGALPAERLVQFPFFFLRRGVFFLVNGPILPFFESSARVTPGAILLPTGACFMQRMQNGEGPHLGKPIASLAQGALQQGEGPGGCGIFFAVGGAVCLLQNPCPLRRPICSRRSWSGQIIQGQDPHRVEASRHSCHWIVAFPARQARRLAQAFPRSYRQQSDGPLVADTWFM